MTEKRFKVAVYDEKAINGFTVLDLYKPNISKRLKYENVYIGSKEGCDIVCKFGNELADENEQLKESNERFSKTVAEQIIMIKEYREENEQLKLSNSQLARVNREGVKKVQKLADENEQLKKGNKTLADGLTAYFESKIKKE